MNMEFDWKGLVRKVAPMLGTAVGGPLGGIAVQAISQAVLGRDNGDEQEIEAALKTATPETLLALKKSEQEFKVKMRELDISEEQLAYDDAASARNRQIATKDKTPDVLAYMLLVAFCGALAGLFYFTVPSDNAKLVYTMLGSLGTLTITAMQYFHGSSRGSARKDETIANRK